MLAPRFARSSIVVKLLSLKPSANFYTRATVGLITRRGLSTSSEYNIIIHLVRVMLGFSRNCCASAMFAHAHMEGRGDPAPRSISHAQGAGSHNIILRIISERVDCPILGHWLRTHSHMPGVSEGCMYLN